MKTNLWIKSAQGAILLTVIYALINFILGQEQLINGLLWGLFANLMIAALVGYYIYNSTLTGLKLGLSVFLIYFLIGHFNILIEAYIFNVTDREQTLIEILRGFLAAAIFCPLYVYMLTKLDAQAPINFTPRSFFGWLWRILVGNFMYLVFYIIAGLILSITLPEMMDFYQDKIPPMDVMIKTQLFLRGFIFVGVAILILRTLKRTKLKKAIFIGLIFAILGGIAPLIQPNELMPLYIRIGHSFEVGISNFLYGLVLAYIFIQKSMVEGQ